MRRQTTVRAVEAQKSRTPAVRFFAPSGTFCSRAISSIAAGSGAGIPADAPETACAYRIAQRARRPLPGRDGTRQASAATDAIRPDFPPHPPFPGFARRRAPQPGRRKAPPGRPLRARIPAPPRRCATGFRRYGFAGAAPGGCRDSHIRRATGAYAR